MREEALGIERHSSLEHEVHRTGEPRGDDRETLALAVLGGQSHAQRLGATIPSQEAHCGFRERPLQVRVADLAARVAEDACRPIPWSASPAGHRTGSPAPAGSARCARSHRRSIAPESRPTRAPFSPGLGPPDRGRGRSTRYSAPAPAAPGRSDRSATHRARRSSSPPLPENGSPPRAADAAWQCAPRTPAGCIGCWCSECEPTAPNAFASDGCAGASDRA